MQGRLGEWQRPLDKLHDDDDDDDNDDEFTRGDTINHTIDQYESKRFPQ